MRPRHCTTQAASGSASLEGVKEGRKGSRPGFLGEEHSGQRYWRSPRKACKTASETGPGTVVLAAQGLALRTAGPEQRPWAEAAWVCERQPAGHRGRAEWQTLVTEAWCPLSATAAPLSWEHLRGPRVLALQARCVWSRTARPPHHLPNPLPLPRPGPAASSAHSRRQRLGSPDRTGKRPFTKGVQTPGRSLASAGGSRRRGGLGPAQTCSRLSCWSVAKSFNSSVPWCLRL